MKKFDMTFDMGFFCCNHIPNRKQTLSNPIIHISGHNRRN
ncbi:hypothetical protein CLOBOL_05246 [Enterocloster bolteae ATCC BAA-613]|uniref:Uncharacterized protein n=1 Tax=Enterocloster bolteae (strain ATCC BAA-613 / DSM 15670 / CCUG 46953 / JCM 12243 / WAL 16351) TaxID=411902 RepID=A8RYW3_ENTBW|nr:hypothetical protein CLOBOL_05246 [Enterocloster bolteae ATCC BAA-613]